MPDYLDGLAGGSFGGLVSASERVGFAAGLDSGDSGCMTVTACFLPKLIPQVPVYLYCVMMAILLETIQYRARSQGNCMVRKPNIMGIIHSMSWLVWAVAGSTAGGVTCFCCNHMVPATSTGKI